MGVTSRFVPAIKATGRVVLLSSLLGVVFVSNAQAQTFGTHQYVEPPYSSIVVGYAQASFDDYSNNASHANVRFEQRILHNMFVSGQYYDFSEPQTNFEFDAEIEDIQFGIGYMERSELGPHADVSLLVGRETFQRPIQEEPFAAWIDRSNYFGLQIGLREAHGPVEAQAGISYLFHDGDRDDQIRWHVGAFLTVWQNISVGLRYQDNEDYSVRSIELRVSW